MEKEKKEYLEDVNFFRRLKYLIRCFRENAFNVKNTMFLTKVSFAYETLFPKLYTWEINRIRKRRKTN